MAWVDIKRNTTIHLKWLFLDNTRLSTCVCISPSAVDSAVYKMSSNAALFANDFMATKGSVISKPRKVATMFEGL